MPCKYHWEGKCEVAGDAAGEMTAANCRGPASIGRLAIEGLGTAAWRLGVPAPEQSRLLLLASTKIRALLKAALCSAMITVPAGATSSTPHQQMCCSAAGSHQNWQTTASGACAVDDVLLKACRELDVALKRPHWPNAGR